MEYLTLKEAGELCGKSANSLIKDVDYIKKGKTWLITKEAVEKLYGKIE